MIWTKLSDCKSFRAWVFWRAPRLKMTRILGFELCTALPIDTDGNFFDVTGTTTITSFSSATAGLVIYLQFDDAVLLHPSVRKLEDSEGLKPNNRKEAEIMCEAGYQIEPIKEKQND